MLRIDRRGGSGTIRPTLATVPRRIRDHPPYQRNQCDRAIFFAGLVALLAITLFAIVCLPLGLQEEVPLRLQFGSWMWLPRRVCAIAW